jgi:hypothetical protein
MLLIGGEVERGFEEEMATFELGQPTPAHAAVD